MVGKVNNYTPSFGARIVQTPYFKEGLHSATNWRCDEISLKQKVDFLNAVTLIQNDDSIGEFKIEGIGGLKNDGKARKCKFVVDGKVTNIDSTRFNRILDGPNCMRAVTEFAQKRYGNVFANNMLSSASYMAKDIDKKQEELHQFVKSDLMDKFHLSDMQMIEDHKKVFNELPNEGLKYIDMYF